MNIKRITTYKDISKALNISENRNDYIVSYIMQMVQDYKGDVVDIVKEIQLNLKDKERHMAMYIIGSSSNSIFSKLNDKDKEEFIQDIMKVLKIREEKAELILQESDNIIDDMRKITNYPSIPNIIKKVVNTGLMDVEKDYLLFTLGMMVM